MDVFAQRRVVKAAHIPLPGIAIRRVRGGRCVSDQRPAQLQPQQHARFHVVTRRGGKDLGVPALLPPGVLSVAAVLTVAAI